MKWCLIGSIAFVLCGSRIAAADELVLPSGLRVTLDAADARAWTASANADGDVLAMAGIGERLEVAIAPSDEDHTCKAMLDGPTTSDLAWGRQVARDFGLPATMHDTVRVDRSHPGAVQRIACADGAGTTLTASWISDDSETDASRASAARVLGAIATAYAAGYIAPAADGGDADGDVLRAPAVPRAPSPGGRHHRELDPPAEAPATDALGQPLLPGAALLVPRFELGVSHLQPTGTMPGAANAVALADRPIVPIGRTDFGYELGGIAGVGDRGALSLGAHAGVGYHVTKGPIGVYVVGGAGFDYVGASGMGFALGAAPDVYAGAVVRTFPTPNVLLEMRGARVIRHGELDETEGTLRVAWTPHGHRAYLVDAFVRDYDGAASMLGTAVGFGF